jgi:hypothetical protein
MKSSIADKVIDPESQHSGQSQRAENVVGWQ